MKKKIIIEVFLLLILGALSSLSLPPFNFFFINFFTFSIFFIFLFKKLNIQFQKKIFFFYGWLFGFGYFLSNMYWITISLTFEQDFNFLIPIAIFLIPAFLSLFYGIVTLIFYIFNFKNIISSFFLFSLLFGLTEYLRGNILTGFPWNLIVYSFSENINFLSFLSIIGTYSFNLFVITFFTAPAIYILRKSKKEILLLSVLLLLPILFLTYGNEYKKNFFSKELKKNPYIIRVISSNISLDRFYEDIETEEVLSELIKLSAPESEKKIFFLWPEGIIPGIYQDQLILYNDIFKKNFTENHLIGLGTTSRLLNNRQYKYFNSFSVVDNKLNLIENYYKINLVPFGEFLPFENFLNIFGIKKITEGYGSYLRGKNQENIIIEKINILPLICYEIIFTKFIQQSSQKTNLIINISEDGWFGNTIGPHQHFAKAIFRAIEHNTFLIRSTNKGISAIINNKGQVIKRLDIQEAGNINMNVPLFESKNKNKNDLIFFVLLITYILAFLILKKNDN